MGNKTDKENERQVTQEEGIELASKKGYKFQESSCLKNENVAGAFEALIELWNIENAKKRTNPKKRRNSGEFKKIENLDDLKPNEFNSQRFSVMMTEPPNIDFYENKNESFKLNNNKGRKKKNNFKIKWC